MSRLSHRRLRAKGRASRSSFVSLPHSLLNHPAMAKLSTRATKLLIDLATQYRGKNNGDLSATLTTLKKRGWKSSDQLFKARDELIDRGLIIVTRQGGRNLCNLYAITWQPIDDCKGKLDICSTIVPSNRWKKWRDGGPSLS